MDIAEYPQTESPLPYRFSCDLSKHKIKFIAKMSFCAISKVSPFVAFSLLWESLNPSLGMNSDILYLSSPYILRLYIANLNISSRHIPCPHTYFEEHIKKNLYFEKHAKKQPTS